jgi:hypothetical protein
MRTRARLSYLEAGMTDRTSSETETLKPCPFCGVGPQIFRGPGYVTVGCDYDGCSINPSVDAPLGDEAESLVVKAWNTRGYAPIQQEPGMQGAVQYRRKDGGYGDRWITMAMFDGTLAAESYCSQQRKDDAWPFEYRAIELTSPDTSTDRPLPVEPDYRDVVRKWFELRLSQQREIAASIGLPPQGTATGIEWGKLVLTTAKDKGELPRVAAAISSALSDSSPECGAGK